MAKKQGKVKPVFTPKGTRQLEDIITSIIKRQIRKKGLIKTGRLINSIDTKLFFDSRNVATITITAVYYFEFLMWRYNVLEDAFGTSEFQDVLELIGRFNINYNFIE